MPRNICHDLSTLKRVLKKWLLLEILKRQDFVSLKLFNRYLINILFSLQISSDRTLASVWYRKELPYLIAIDFVARISFLQRKQALRKFMLFKQKQNRHSRMRYLNFDRKGRTNLDTLGSCLPCILTGHFVFWTLARVSIRKRGRVNELYYNESFGTRRNVFLQTWQFFEGKNLICCLLRSFLRQYRILRPLETEFVSL